MGNKREIRVVAFDFDGSIVDSIFPNIYGLMPGAKETINRFRANGGIAILWTCRDGEYLEAAIEFCRKNGIEFDYVNENIPEREFITSRKIWADLYVDDLSIGGVDWRQVNLLLNGEWL